MKLVIWSMAVLAFSLGACNRERDRSLPGAQLRDPNEQDRSGTTTLTGASLVPNDTAIDRLVAARCAREVMCSNIGPDKHFTSAEVCTREVRDKMHDELKASACPRGIGGKELDECLDRIRNESCSNAIESLGRLAACRTGELCLEAEMPRR